MYCLLEDDRLITSINIANDRLLKVDSYSKKAFVIIDVRPTASLVTLDTMAVAF